MANIVVIFVIQEFFVYQYLIQSQANECIKSTYAEDMFTTCKL
jgi:hypothetical protein